MKTGGVNIILILGLINMLLLGIQVSSGLRWIKLPFGVHRKSGILLCITGIIHGLLAMAS